jgi:hypothetical protein
MMAKRCPSKAEIIRYLEAAGSGNGFQQEFLDHIAACPECRIVLEASLEIRSRSGSLINELQGLNPKSSETAKSLRVQARREIRLLRRTGRPALRRWLAIPAAGVAFALVAALLLVPGRHPGRTGSRERGSSALEISLVRPRGRVPVRELDFQWTHEPGVQSCRLEIYNQILEPVYQSAPLVQDHIALPASALGSFHRGAVYFWKVVVTLKNSQTIESEFAAFIPQK